MAMYTSPGFPSPDPTQTQPTGPTQGGTGGADPAPATFSFGGGGGGMGPAPTTPSPAPTPVGSFYPPMPQPGTDSPYQTIPGAPTDWNSKAAQLKKAWLQAQKGVGQTQPLRGMPSTGQNPFIKQMGGGMGRPTLGRGWAGPARFQKGMRDSYTKFLGGTATGGVRPMPQPGGTDWRKNLGSMMRPSAPTEQTIQPPNPRDEHRRAVQQFRADKQRRAALQQRIASRRSAIASARRGG